MGSSGAASYEHGHQCGFILLPGGSSWASSCCISPSPSVSPEPGMCTTLLMKGKNLVCTSRLQMVSDRHTGSSSSFWISVHSSIFQLLLLSTSHPIFLSYFWLHWFQAQHGKQGQEHERGCLTTSHSWVRTNSYNKFYILLTVVLFV